MLKTLIALTCISVSTALPLAADEGNGGYAGSFFQIPLGARPVAMGGAYRSISNDGAGPLYNPAGLSLISHKLFGSSYRVMEQDRRLGYATFAFPVRGQTAIGVHWLYAGSGSVEARDSDGQLLGRDISFNNHEFGIIFAKRFERYFSFGANLNYLQSTFPEEEATSVGFDLGGILFIDELFDRNRREDMAVRDIRAGLTVRHLGKVYKWDSENYNVRYSPGSESTSQEDRVPIEIGLAASARFLDRKLLVASDLVKIEKQDPVWHVGAEYFVRPEFALRSGYYQGRFTAGTGYVFTIGSTTLAVDYAFTTDRVDEGSEHIISFDLLVK
jgi:hypothetical protein